MLLHCPTGHLSAVVAGIASGELPSGPPPAPSVLRAFFARFLRRRRYGQVEQIPAGTGGPVLVLSRGWAGPVVDAALGQVVRLTGGSLVVRPGPAIRLSRSPAGFGGLPAPMPVRPAPLGLRVLLRVAALALGLGWRGPSDYAGALASRRCYRDLAQRARLLPGSSPLPAGGAAPAPAPAQAQAPALAVGPPRAVYHCFGATHSSLVAASLHAGKLPAQGRLSPQDICRVPGFDARTPADIGRAVYVGEGGGGQPVFAIGLGPARRALAMALAGTLRYSPPGGPQVVLADALSCVSPLVKLGGYLSRRLHLVTVGRYLAARGISHSTGGLRRTVEGVRDQMTRQAARIAGGPASSA